jgi:hypothetical protein
LPIDAAFALILLAAELLDDTEEGELSRCCFDERAEIWVLI